MAEHPILPFFTDAYLSDTRHLTTIQHGAYLLMLMTAWRAPDCSLPDDDCYLARITGMDKRTWASNKATLLSFWRLNDKQKWEQGRLKDERNFVEQKRNKNAANGRSSALKRNNRGSTTVQPEPNQISTPTPTPLNKKNPSDSKKGTRFDLVVMPDDWKNYCLQEIPNANAQRIFDEFRDYWIAKAGSDGVKLDWLATWRNWVRRRASDAKPTGGGLFQQMVKPTPRYADRPQNIPNIMDLKR